MALNARQERFCEEYMKHKNATQAYLTAYGCTYNAAKVNASKLLTNPNVISRIDAMMDAERTRLRVDRQRIIDEAAKIAFLNQADLIDLRTGRVRMDAKRDDLAAISEVRSDTEASLLGGRTSVCVKVYDKIAALRFLRDMLGEGMDAEGTVRIMDDTDALDESVRQEMMDLSALESAQGEAEEGGEA